MEILCSLGIIAVAWHGADWLLLVTADEAWISYGDLVRVRVPIGHA